MRGENLQLFGIDPIKLTFANFFRAALRQRPFLAVRNADQPQIVIAHEADVAAVRRNLGIGDALFPGYQRARGLRLRIEPSQ